MYYTGQFLAEVVPKAKFTPGSEEGQLVVWATAKDHAQIKTLIEQLQKAPPPELARTIKVYTLQHVTAAAAMTFVVGSPQGRGDGGPGRPAAAQRLGHTGGPQNDRGDPEATGHQTRSGIGRHRSGLSAGGDEPDSASTTP